jgi:hypothetical protein
MTKMLTLDSSFKKIPGFSNDYRISEDGTVVSFKYNKIKILKPIARSNGYVSVTLTEDKKSKSMYVHRLVALTFIKNKDNKAFVNHINGIKTDNKVENLEWVTHAENLHHLKSVRDMYYDMENIRYDKLTKTFFFFTKHSGYTTLMQAKKAKKEFNLL